MKVLFIIPRRFGHKNHAGRLPLGLLYISSYIKRNIDVKVKLIDCLAQNLSMEKTLHMVKEFDPDLIGISVVTHTIKDSLKLCSKIKSFTTAKIALGGLHATYMSENLIKNKYVDYIVHGEGEITFLELCKYIKKKIKVEEIAGITYFMNNKINRNLEIKLVQDLDKLPFPDRSLIDHNLYFQNYPKTTTSILGSRGCNYSCIYCSHKIAFGQKIRKRSPTNIVAEIKECIHNYEIHNFEFIDSLFGSSKNDVILFCNQVIKENLKIKWRCQTRIDTFVQSKNFSKQDIKNLLLLMNKSGCEWIFFGIDSGSQKILDLNKKAQNLSEVKIVLDYVRKAGIKIEATFVLGLKGETKQTINETLDFARNLNIDNLHFTGAWAFPGTEFYDSLVEKNQIRKDYWHENSDSNYNGLIEYSEFSGSELSKTIKKALVQHKLNPAYVAKKATTLIRQPQNIKSYYLNAKKFLSKM